MYDRLGVMTTFWGGPFTEEASVLYFLGLSFEVDIYHTLTPRCSKELVLVLTDPLVFSSPPQLKRQSGIYHEVIKYKTKAQQLSDTK